MSKPSLNHVPAFQCSQIRKLCRSASIFSVSRLVNQSDFDYRTHHRNLCEKYISAGTHHNQHGDFRERQRFVAHAELRRLSVFTTSEIRLYKSFMSTLEFLFL